MKIKFLVQIAIVLLMGTSAYAQKVTTDFAPGTDFSQYHTYASGEGRPARNPLIAQRIVSGIDTQLAAKGLRKVGEGEAADLIVAYQTSTDTQTEINTYNTGGWGGWGWGWGGGTAQTTVRKIPVGQLIVDLGDVKAKKFVWRGQASGTISDKPEKLNKALDKALVKMFEKHPPKEK
jgi:Domain of unknown function (DUF4136)